MINGKYIYAINQYKIIICITFKLFGIKSLMTIYIYIKCKTFLYVVNKSKMIIDMTFKIISN